MSTPSGYYKSIAGSDTHDSDYGTPIRSGHNPGQEATEADTININPEMLMSAAETGNLSLAQRVLEAAPNKVDLSKLKSGEVDQTPLHAASRAGHREIALLLLEHNFSPFHEDPNKNTSLHIAASNGHSSIALDMLEYMSRQDARDVSKSVRLNVFHLLNEEGRSPLGCALFASPEPHISVAREFLNHVQGQPESAFIDFSKVIFPKFESLPLNKPVNIFVLGDHNVGKSTVISALQEDSSLLSAIANRRTTEATYRHFSGIVSTDFFSSSFKRVVFFDLAAHTNYYNRKLFESCDDLASSVFLILVNLTDDRPRLFKRLVYWLNFLQYYILRERCTVKPNTVIVGTHLDMRKTFFFSNDRLLDIYSDVIEYRPELTKCFEFKMKPVSVDCRKLASFEIRHLRNSLQRICQKMKPPSKILPSSMCYILTAAFDQPPLNSMPVLSLGELARKLAECRLSFKLNYSKLLPDHPEELLSLCRTLHNLQRILLFENATSDDIEKTFIVHNSHLLLMKIDQQLTSLNTSVEDSTERGMEKSMFRKTFLANSGIISRDILESSLSSQNLNLDPKLAVQLLLHFKYCEAVFTKGADGQDQYFFLPSLLGDIPTPDPWRGDGFGFAWCISPCTDQAKEIECFLPCFLKRLLLALIQRFIQNPSSLSVSADDDQSSVLSTIERSEVGSRAISWLTAEGINVIIVTNDDAIILNMYCSQPGVEMSSLRLRNCILSTIREVKDQWQHEIETADYLIPFGEKFPVLKMDNRQWVSLNHVQNAIMNDLNNCDGVSLQSLIFHDPCMILSKLDKPTQLVFLDTEGTDPEVEQKVLRDIYSTFEREAKELYSQYHLPDIITAQSPFSENPGSQSGINVLNTSGNDNSSSEGRQTSQSSRSSQGSLASRISQRRHHSFKTYSALLLHFDTFSIFKTKDFLADLQMAPTLETATEGNLETVEELPFVSPMSKFLCNGNGRTITLQQHGITIKIPVGAVSKNMTVGIEFGVLLSGPFEVPSDVRIVSPILWLGASQKDFKFNKQVDIYLPHCINTSNPEVIRNLSFFKSQKSDIFSDVSFILSPTKEARFPESMGVLSVKQPGLFCICYRSPRDMALRSKYSIIRAVPKESNIIDSNFMIYYFVTPALRSCLEMVSRKYPGMDYVRNNFMFKVQSDDSEPALKISYECNLPNGWMAPLKDFTREIVLSDINIHVLDDSCDYPPRFTIDVSGDNATRNEVLQVSFSGATKPLDSEYLLKLTAEKMSSTVVSHYSSKRSLFGSSHSLETESRLLDRIIADLVKYLAVDTIRIQLTVLGIFTEEELKALHELSASPRANQVLCVEKLVQVLKRKGDAGMVAFRQALELTQDGTGHKSILDILEQNANSQVV